MFKSFCLSAVLLVSSTALAFPLPKPGMSIESLPAAFTSNYDFEGIVGLSNCSGSLIRLENSRDTDKGLILTNGHCLEAGMPQPGTFVYGKPSSRWFNLYNSTGRVGRVTASQIVYSTMTKTDMTIYKLNETYEQIMAAYKVRPLTLSSQRSAIGTPMQVISGYWNRGYSCNIEAFINTLKEDRWTMNDSIRYSRPGCLVIGGTSGSPVIQTGTRTVIGVNNTGNEDGESCTMNNPCEIDEKGVTSAHKDYSYGQQTFQVYSCLNQYNEIDLSVNGCQLFH